MKVLPRLWIILLWPLLLASGARPATAVGDVQITFTTNPSQAQIRPHGGPTGQIAPDEAIIEVRDTRGALIPNVQIDFQMDAPQTNWFISTDVPRIEGVTLLKYRFVSPTGRQTFDYIFPIRGDYRLTIQASPLTPGAFTATTKTLNLHIAEKESSLVNLAGFLALLLGFGALSGFLIARSHLAARAGVAPAQVSLTPGALTLLIVAAAGWVAFLAYAEVADARETEVSLRAAQLVETASASNAHAKLKLSVEAPQTITPSQPATLIGRLTDANGAPISSVHYDVSVIQIEDSKTVFAASADSVDGTFNWTYDFWDGTEHAVEIVASPASGSAAHFEPLILEHTVDITPLAPPLRVKLLNTSYLTALIGLGVAAGVGLARRRARAG
ncbi:MAG: hypothetical protein HY260_04560 [Chloroflexi bacterium]|nr:hypothetical protein [Chloroflexota bacterium]